MVWKVEKERLVDITRAMDKVVLWLLFSSIGAFSTAIVLERILTWRIPDWIGIVGIILSVVLLTMAGILGTVLEAHREIIYQKWLERKTAGKVGVRAHTGTIISRLKTAGAEERPEWFFAPHYARSEGYEEVDAESRYDIWVKLDGKTGGKMLFSDVCAIAPEPLEVSDTSTTTEMPSMIAPEVGSRVRITIVAHYNKHGRELLRETTLYQDNFN